METCDLDFQKNKPDLPGEERHCTWGSCAFGWACKPTSLREMLRLLRLSDPQQHLSSLQRTRARLTGWSNEVWLGFLEATVYLISETLRGLSDKNKRERRRRKKWNLLLKRPTWWIAGYLLLWVLYSINTPVLVWATVTSRAYMDWVA